MSLDRTLKSRSALARHRNVLTRAERVEKLKDEERWDESKSVFKLPKVAHRKSLTHKAKKEEKAAVPGAEAGAVAAAEAPAADAKKPDAKKPGEKKPAEKKGAEKKG